MIRLQETLEVGIQNGLGECRGGEATMEGKRESGRRTRRARAKVNGQAGATNAQCWQNTPQYPNSVLYLGDLTIDNSIMIPILW